MSLAITATEVGTSTPRTVQVIVTGLTAGESYEVRGQWAGGSWPVRAGAGIAEAGQVVRTDIHTPVNVSLYYTVVSEGVAVTSAPVTVDYHKQYVLQSLDGRAATAFTWLDNGAPRELGIRTAVFRIPGRSRPIIRYDVPAGESGELWIGTQGVDSGALRSLVGTGAPLLLRSDGRVADLAAVEIVQVTGLRSALSGGFVEDEADRRWTLMFEVIGDPEPNTVVAASTWEDFDLAYAGLTWADFDAEWADQTWNAFDVTDWDTRSSLAVEGDGFGSSVYGESPYGL